MKKDLTEAEILAMKEVRHCEMRLISRPSIIIPEVKDKIYALPYAVQCRKCGKLLACVWDYEVYKSYTDQFNCNYVWRTEYFIRLEEVGK